MKLQLFLVACIVVFASSIGCGWGSRHKGPMITAVSLNNDCHWGQETGIPFYLPKPLLIVAKNFRNIETPTVGLTDSAPIPTGYDDQSKYADVNARTNFNFDGGGTGTSSETQSGTDTGSAAKSGPVQHSQNGAPVTPFTAPSDGLGPDTFYTYHIVYVPDLTQKYGLKICGGPGEIRAAMNLVNGWQYTGMGPYYSKDSSTAQNIISRGIATRLGGQAAKDVLTGVADLVGTKPGGATQSGGEFDSTDPRIQQLSHTISQLPRDMAPMVIPAFAEIHVYEPSLGPDGMMSWSEIANCVFNREYLGVKTRPAPVAAGNTPANGQTDQTGQTGQTQSGGEFATNQDLANSAIAAVFGVTPGSTAIQPAGATQSGGEFDSKSTSPVNQINVNCDDGCVQPQAPQATASSRKNLFSRFKNHKSRKQDSPKYERKVVRVPAGGVSGQSFKVSQALAGNGANDPGVTTTATHTGALDSVGGGLQTGGEFGGSTNPVDGAIFNQPTINQPKINNTPANSNGSRP